MKQKILPVLLAVVAILTASSPVSAQNANRKGWIIELQGGRVLGALGEIDLYNPNTGKGETAYRQSGGISGAVSFGYRWTTSQFCAVEAKVLVGDNFAETKLLSVALLPGFRYNTKEFSGNLGMYFAINAGGGLMPVLDEIGYMALGEIGIGLNLSNRISLGLFVDYYAPFGDGEIQKSNLPFHDLKGETSYMELTSNATIGLKLGFRI